MEIIIETFDERIEDIEIYIKYLEGIDPVFMESKLRNILIANGYLLLYNLIEATLQSICTQIHKTIEKENLNYESLSEPLRLVYWNSLHLEYNFKDSKKFQTKLINIANELLARNTVSFNKHNPIRGNVSSEKIREVAKLYGLPHTLHKNSSEDQTITNITRKRQILAHGEDSFSSLGSEVVISDLNDQFKRTQQYLNNLINSVDKYLRTKQYLNIKRRNSKKTSTAIVK
jgi:hypothetical protein